MESRRKKKANVAVRYSPEEMVKRARATEAGRLLKPKTT